MRLTLYTDYSLRVLIYLGTHDQGLSAIADISRAYGISRNHLMKVVNGLCSAGYVSSVRGRSGGIRLGRPAAEINIGEVVRRTEDSLDLVDCASCLIAPACGLTGALRQAVRAFMKVLDAYTLADLLARRGKLAALLAVPTPAIAPAPAKAMRTRPRL